MILASSPMDLTQVHPGLLNGHLLIPPLGPLVKVLQSFFALYFYLRVSPLKLFCSMLAPLRLFLTLSHILMHFLLVQYFEILALFLLMLAIPQLLYFKWTYLLIKYL